MKNRLFAILSFVIMLSVYSSAYAQNFSGSWSGTAVCDDRGSNMVYGVLGYLDGGKYEFRYQLQRKPAIKGSWSGAVTKTQNGVRLIGIANLPDGTTLPTDARLRLRETSLHGEFQNCYLRISNPKLNTPARKPEKKKTALHKAFNKLSLDKRKSVQAFLLDKSYYNARIDGLFGPSTSRALREYNQNNLKNQDLTTDSSIAVLFEHIDEQLRITAKQSIKTEKKSDDLESSSISPEVTEVTEVSDPSSIGNDAPSILRLKDLIEKKDFQNARDMAVSLILSGHVEAQFVLGNLYKNGDGILKLKKHAHMWFNIAAMNGVEGASEQRDALAESMSISAVEAAEEMAAGCLKKFPSQCELPAIKEQKYQTSKTISQPEDWSPSSKELRDGFVELSRNERFQYQYALNKLGYYSSSIDGLWGLNTERAVTKFLGDNAEVLQVERILPKLKAIVEVPSTFDSVKPKKRQVVSKPKEPESFRNSDTAGLRPIVAEPSISGRQAFAICDPKAEMIADQTPVQTGRGTINCRTTSTGHVFGNIGALTADSRTRCHESGGNDWPGLIPLLLETDPKSRAKRKAEDTYQLALDACLAGYGWKK